MKTLRVSLGQAEATRKLRESLRTISDDALRQTDQIGFYGNIVEGTGETNFTIGIGPTSFTTAKGSIVDDGTSSSEISYVFKGPFWAFLKRTLIEYHIKQVFARYMTEPNSSEDGRKVVVSCRTGR